ncbi:uncharacterized protein F5147DRAFT_764354 [Suillus discolor]|uniref:Uncharacterized protein n=1 Tax=Suillus discolor TaxID=1912936 RepID=A0A9P7JN39_9AGAM|nr:uncharacterized protein F5147DRAFT_764354 [Suillus discolor]KAG2091036.1 hypothetical protein F5147DRAFT_764354 [Suillus discolor]
MQLPLILRIPETDRVRYYMIFLPISMKQSTTHPLVRSLRSLKAVLLSGLTTDVIYLHQPQYVWDTSNSSVTHTTSTTLEGFITGLRLWNISANCGISTLVVQEYAAMMMEAEIGAPREAAFFLPSEYAQDLGLSTKCIRASSWTVSVSIVIKDSTIGECPTTVTHHWGCQISDDQLAGAFSFIIGHGYDTPNHLSSRVNGTMSISTISWTKTSLTWYDF